MSDDRDEEALDLAAEMFGDAPDDPSDEHPLLTNAELAEIREEARAKIAKEAKAKARKEALEREIAQAKREAGEAGYDLKTDQVTIHVDLPEFCSDIRIDGKIYFHGRTYPVQRHIADSIREQMYRAWLHQRDIDGKSLVSFYEKSKTMGGIRSLNRGGSVSGKGLAA